jgi:hypothetical protein
MLGAMSKDSADSVKVRRTRKPVNLDEVVDQPVAVYVEATDAEIDASRSGMSTTDFGVVADDLMFYRSSATQYLDQHGVPYLRITGRRPIRFMVDGEVQEFDFADVELLDFIVVYDGRSAPRVLAPNDIGSPTTNGDTILGTRIDTLGVGNK